MADSSTRNALTVLYDEIEARCQAVAATRPTWPCHRGCGHCCRHLSSAPRLVAAEWRQIERGLDRLDADTRATVEARLAEVAQQDGGPVVCPFLDREREACRIYAERPAVCRTYGFYQSRDGGRFCHLVESHVAEGHLADDSAIVWGSQAAVDRHLDRLAGPTIGLAEWLAEREAVGSQTSVTS